MLNFNLKCNFTSLHFELHHFVHSFSVFNNAGKDDDDDG